MKIGIEVELHSDSGMSSYDIKEDSNLSYSEFRKIENSTIGVKMSEEYYSDTIEYNFTPFDVTIENFEIVKEFLEKQIEKYELVLSTGNPKFVGTHIHIFTEEYFSLSYPILLQVLMNYICDNIGDLQRMSIERLMLAHQLWTRWSHRNDHKWFDALKEYGIRPQYYDHHRTTSKYQPIINSRASATGKPKSLEVRFIPNEFIFNGKAYDIMKEIEEGTFLNRKKMKAVDFIHMCGSELKMKKREEQRHQETATQDYSGRPISTDTAHNLAFAELVAERGSSTYTDYVNSEHFITDIYHLPDTIANRWSGILRRAHTRYSIGIYNGQIEIFQGNTAYMLFRDMSFNTNIAESYAHLPIDAINYIRDRIKHSNSHRDTDEMEGFIALMYSRHEELSRENESDTDEEEGVGYNSPVTLNTRASADTIRQMRQQMSAVRWASGSTPNSFYISGGSNDENDEPLF